MRVVYRVAAVLLLLSGGTLAATLALRDSGGSTACNGSLVVNVEAAAAVDVPVRQATDAYQRTSPAVDGRCVEISVTSRPPSESVAMLASGWQEPAAGPVPDVWIPDSTLWLDAARTDTAGQQLLPDTGPTLASSPVVIAMPRSMAQALGWPDKRPSWKDVQTFEGDQTFWTAHGHPDWGQFRLVASNPNGSAASMSAMLSVVAAVMGEPVMQLTPDLFTDNVFAKKAVLDFERNSERVVANDMDLLSELRTADAEDRLLAYMSAAPMAESAVFAYNRGLVGAATPPSEPLVAVHATDGTPVADVPFMVLSGAGADPARATAVQEFLDALRGEIGQNAFAQAGFRTPDGVNDSLTQQAGFSPTLRSEPAGQVGPGVVLAAGETFRGIHQRGTTLAVLDTSGSMANVVPDSNGKTRLQLVVAAYNAALPLFAEESAVGLWQFSTRLDGDRDYVQMVPIGPLNEPVNGVPRVQALTDAANSLVPRSGTGLYDTVLAAFRELTRVYAPGRPNQVVLMTDGRNTDPSGISFEELISTLKAEFNEERPVRIISVVYGEEADSEALRQISEATGAKSYPALDQNSIFQVLVDALTAR